MKKIADMINRQTTAAHRRDVKLESSFGLNIGFWQEQTAPWIILYRILVMLSTCTCKYKQIHSQRRSKFKNNNAVTQHFLARKLPNRMLKMNLIHVWKNCVAKKTRQIHLIIRYLPCGWIHPRTWWQYWSSVQLHFDRQVWPKLGGGQGSLQFCPK